MREMKFRAITFDNKIIKNVDQVEFFESGTITISHGLIVKQLIQYTGLRDSTGREIFEGDLLLFKSRDYKTEIVYEVIFDNGSYYAKFVNSEVPDSLLKELGLFNERHRMPDFPYYLEQTIEVIGDKFSNPELLNNK